MRVAFLQFDCREGTREGELAAALRAGVRSAGDECRIVRIGLPFEKLLISYELDADLLDSLDADVVGMVSVRSQAWLKHCWATGRGTLFFDKGYRNPLRQHRGADKHGLWRVAVDAHQPTEYVATARHNPGRWEKLFGGDEPRPWRAPAKGKAVIIANSAGEYSRLFDLPPPIEWVTEVAAEVRRHSERPIWFRPKPGWDGARSVSGTTFCPHETVAELLRGAHALITYTSYISLDAMLYGVPSVVLGNAVTRPISSTDLAQIEEPYLASDEERRQLLANLAWTQFFIHEWTDGSAWRKLRELFL
jgi:hypothetical protein